MKKTPQWVAGNRTPHRLSCTPSYLGFSEHYQLLLTNEESQPRRMERSRPTRALPLYYISLNEVHQTKQPLVAGARPSFLSGDHHRRWHSIFVEAYSHAIPVTVAQLITPVSLRHRLLNITMGDYKAAHWHHVECLGDAYALHSAHSSRRFAMTPPFVPPDALHVASTARYTTSATRCL